MNALTTDERSIEKGLETDGTQIDTELYKRKMRSKDLNIARNTAYVLERE